MASPTALGAWRAHRTAFPAGDLPGVGSIGAGEGSSTIAMRPCGTRIGDCFDLGAISGGVEANGDVAPSVNQKWWA